MLHDLPSYLERTPNIFDVSVHPAGRRCVRWARPGCWRRPTGLWTTGKIQQRGVQHPLANKGLILGHLGMFGEMSKTGFNVDVKSERARRAV